VAERERSSPFDRLRTRTVRLGTLPVLLVLSLSKDEDRAELRQTAGALPFFRTT
jgi:hypothetical protein